MEVIHGKYDFCPISMYFIRGTSRSSVFLLRMEGGAPFSLKILCSAASQHRQRAFPFQSWILPPYQINHALPWRQDILVPHRFQGLAARYRHSFLKICMHATISTGANLSQHAGLPIHPQNDPIPIHRERRLRIFVLLTQWGRCHTSTSWTTQAQNV